MTPMCDLPQKHLGRRAIPPVDEWASEYLWHSDSTGATYWCGCWYHRTPRQLKLEAESTLRDLRREHPEIFTADAENAQLIERAEQLGFTFKKHKNDWRWTITSPDGEVCVREQGAASGMIWLGEKVNELDL